MYRGDGDFYLSASFRIVSTNSCGWSPKYTKLSSGEANSRFIVKRDRGLRRRYSGEIRQRGESHCSTGSGLREVSSK